ncbi:MAG: carboxylesterase family protein [Steroidobacteraceae bacterium]
MQQLLDYQRYHLVGSPGGLTPVIDGRILREPTGKAFAAGRVSKVPYLTGGTDWEGSLVRMPGALGPVLEVVNATRAEADAAYHERDEQALAVALYSDFFFSSQRWLARQHARNGHPTYAYRFARVLEQHRGELPGAAHGAEARYVFGTLDTLHDIAGPDRPGDMGWRVTDADRAYADLVARYWVQFARTGNPNGEGLPAWPAVGRSDDAVLEFGQQQPAPWKDPHPERWAFFSHHFDSGRL